MKIGILTFHTPINYGAILQAYALQKYLKVQYPERYVENIDFKTEDHIKKYNIFISFRKNLLAYFIQQFFILLRYPSLKLRKNRFINFYHDELTLTKRYFTEDELLSDIPSMDFYIVGSDQVFHPNANYLRAYYLNFNKGKAKKIAYAPSFGISSFDDLIKKRIQPFLEDYDSLSCREIDGANFMSSFLKDPIPVVLDPIFLLSQEQWLSMATKSDSKEKYIFVYDLNGGYNLLEIAKKIKNETGLKIICQTQFSSHFYKDCNQIYDSGPREFISLIANAEYVVTDSFHGTAFSILFDKKQFIYIARPKASGRIRSIMEIAGISNRIVEYNSFRNFSFEIESEINLEELNRMIWNSKEYLKNSLK